MLEIFNTQFMIFSLSIAESFRSRKQSWYYRCIGVDPPYNHVIRRSSRLFPTGELCFPSNRRRVHAGRGGGSRILISVTVVGSAGPFRSVVNENELVAAVVDTTLKSYARDGRLPVLGTKLSDFVLYCPITGAGGLRPWETIGSFGARNFMLCKKPEQVEEEDGREKSAAAMEITRKSSGRWKSRLFNKLLSNKVTSH